MVCVVEDTARGRLLPACAAKAEAGMVIETDSETVHNARRAVLELLLSEHQGDCEAPCERACPAGLNIPLMLRCLMRGDQEAAQALARRALVLPATLGRVCTAPCEAGCRRGTL
jgi:NADPH-dependent glutamate synthase beta subunit-like oxidoreductase